jgi:hypothetical protein
VDEAADDCGCGPDEDAAAEHPAEPADMLAAFTALVPERHRSRDYQYSADASGRGYPGSPLQDRIEARGERRCGAGARVGYAGAVEYSSEDMVTQLDLR